MKKILIPILIIFLTGTYIQAQQLAFPTAEGYGKYTVGGRGGKVYEVTNLNDYGSGSLRAAVEASGPRIVVFRVSGTITLNSRLEIKHPYITIAGQTAPGDGICIRRYPLIIAADQVIIRFIRVRFGDESGEDDDAVSSRFQKNIILDHVSASWSVDETMSVYHCDSVTIQWCIVSESLYMSNHVKGHHGFGGIWGSNYSSYHHNLIAHHSSRNPRMASGTGYFDYRNNVIYNWGYNSCYGGENAQEGDPNHAFTEINMVANYYKPGPATRPGDVTHRIANPGYRDVKSDYGKWYIADNLMVGDEAVTANNWKGGVQPDGGLADTSIIKLAEPWPAMAINQQTAEEAYHSVLDLAGCSFPKRDTVDARVVHDTRFGNATFEGATYKKDQSVPDDSKICGIIDTEADVGGWPELKSAPAPADSDHDGMPDDWETEKGLNPNDSNDSKLFTLDDSYTNLEVYINSIININTKVPVTGINLSPETLEMGINEVVQLIESILPANSSNTTILWTSSNPDVAIVSGSGLVSGVAYGTTNIVATTQDGNFKDSCLVTVKNIPVTGVSIPETDSVRIGGSFQLTPTIQPSNASNTNVTWSSSDTAVAAVDSTGIFTGLKEGISNIVVTTEDGTFSDTCVVKVYFSELPLPLVELNFNENSGLTVLNSGSVPVNFTKTETPTWSTNVPRWGGSSLDFGTSPGNYYVESDTIIDQLKSLISFTVTGWVNCRDISTGSGGNRIVTWINSGGDGVDIVHDENGSLKVGINEWPDHTIAVSSTGEITADPNAGPSNWKFFAVTYDSGSSTFNMYFGDKMTQAALDKSFNYNKGTVGTSIGHLCIGQFNSESIHYGTNRMFKGLIDQIAIYDSVLQPDEIQTVQEGGTPLAVSNEVRPEFGLNVYPNPFTSSTTLSYRLTATSNISLKVYDMLGNEVATLDNGLKPTGSYKAIFDILPLSSVIYFARLTVTPQDNPKSYVEVKKIVFTK